MRHGYVRAFARELASESDERVKEQIDGEQEWCVLLLEQAEQGFGQLGKSDEVVIVEKSGEVSKTGDMKSGNVEAQVCTSCSAGEWRRLALG